MSAGGVGTGRGGSGGGRGEAAWGRAREWLEGARGQLELAPEGEAKQALMAACGERFPMPVMAGEI